MKLADFYVNLKGEEIPLSGVDSEERDLLNRLRRKARTRPPWAEFGNYWTREVAAFYDFRGLTRAQARRTPVYRVAQDLGSRLGVAQGLVRSPDYRVELDELIRRSYPNRRAFCEATGLSEDMVSEVLAGRQDLSLAELTAALGRIGYRLRIAPVPEVSGTITGK